MDIICHIQSNEALKNDRRVRWVKERSEENGKGRDQTHRKGRGVVGLLENERWKVNCVDRENFNQNPHLNKSCLSNRLQEIVMNI